MKIIEVLRIPKYFLIALSFSLVFAVIYIYTQVLGIIQNVDLWFGVIPWYNLVLFAAFSTLFGITLSFQIYNWKQPKTCAIGKKSFGASSGATVLSFFVAQCPACASLGALLLPSVVFVSVFVKYNTVFTLASIGLMLFTINYLGGFKRPGAISNSETTESVQK